MRIHTGEKLFECTICNKLFPDRGSMTRHMRMHTGQKSFECEICLKSFSHMQNMNKHRVHTGEKLFKSN